VDDVLSLLFGAPGKQINGRREYTHDRRSSAGKPDTTLAKEKLGNNVLPGCAEVHNLGKEGERVMGQDSLNNNPSRSGAGEDEPPSFKKQNRSSGVKKVGKDSEPGEAIDIRSEKTGSPVSAYGERNG